MNIDIAPSRALRINRISSDDVWPLRRADGRTWSEAKADRERAMEDAQ